MKDIKVGDFVWHGEYGKGICADADWYHSYSIIFEGKDRLIYVSYKERKSLFKKGDLIVGERCDSKSIYKGTFIGWTDSSDMENKLIVKDERFSIIDSYCSTMKHQEEPLEISVVLKVNGKEVDPKSLSKETWENLREEKGD